jgi:hypothetical protein
MYPLRQVLELLYFLSGPMLAILAVLGLRQIQIARQTLQQSRDSSLMMAKRESFRIATEQCKYYYETLTPMFNHIDELIDKNQLQFFKNAKVIVDQGGIALYPSKDKDALSKLMPHVPYIVNTVNCLDSFALHFTSGVAAEEAVFSSLGDTYCNTVRKLIPFILAGNKNGKDFQNILSLFHIWHLRGQRIALMRDKQNIEKKLGDTKDVKIDAIGT